MRAIILVAGRGRRLPTHISNKPKSLINLSSSKTLIEYQLENLKKKKIKKIALVTGYKKSLFKKFKIKKFNNKKWSTSNMVSSLIKADNWLSKNSCIVSYGDIFYTMRNLKGFLNSKKDIAILYDSRWKKYWKKRFKNPLNDAESFIIRKDNSITEIGKKTKKYSDIMGQYMGVIKFTPFGWKKFKKTYNDFPKNEKEKIYMTDVLNKITKTKTKIYGYKYSDDWIEIDTFKDYKIANNFFKSYKND